MYASTFVEAAAADRMTGGHYWRHPVTGIPFVPPTSRVGSYMDHLREKFGDIRLSSVSHDTEALQTMGDTMHGCDVVIAPLIYERMSENPPVASYFERKISEFFDAEPGMAQEHARKGLEYRPCGVVIHSDSTVTYICGDTSFTGMYADTAHHGRYFCGQRMETLARQSTLEDTTCTLPEAQPA